MKVVDYSRDISKYLSAVFILSPALFIAITSTHQGSKTNVPTKFQLDLPPSCFDCKSLIETVSLLRCQHKLDSHQDISK